MQDECDEIYPAVLVNSIYGSYAERKLHEADTPFVAKMYGPQKQNKNGEYKVLYTAKFHKMVRIALRSTASHLK